MLLGGLALTNIIFDRVRWLSITAFALVVLSALAVKAMASAILFTPDNAFTWLTPSAAGGLLIGVWFINPDLDEGQTGPPFPIPVSELDALFAEKFDIVEDYIPTAAYAGREGRERIRVLRKR